jgi:uncharacterized membrane protein (UPF0127 family)
LTAGRPALTLTLLLLMAPMVLWGCGGAEPLTPRVVIGDTPFAAEIARTPSERAGGLSDREELPAGSGMLFVFETGQTPTLWMKGMRFPLDIVWIGEECIVVDAHVDVPVPLPGTADAELSLYRPAAPAAYALELNAGEVARSGVRVGDDVRFSDFPRGVIEASC